MKREIVELLKNGFDVAKGRVSVNNVKEIVHGEKVYQVDVSNSKNTRLYSEVEAAVEEFLHLARKHRTK